MIKFCQLTISSLLLLVLAGCAADPMETPLAATDQLELTQSLLDMRGQLSDSDYAALVAAVATIRTYDLRSLSIEQYYASLDGKTPEQIIARAAELPVSVAAQQDDNQEQSGPQG